jgi:O-antigen/teichoic acid export membrane protein
MVNTAIMSVLGFIFWTVATHLYPPSAIGVFSGVTAGIGLLATIATLGFQNTITRHLARSENPRGLILAAIAVIATVGTTLCLTTVVTLGPHLPSELGLQQRNGMVLLVTILVVVSAVSTALDAGLIASRASNALLTKNVVASIVKLAALVPLAMFRSSGVLLAYSLGLIVGTGGGSIAIIRQIDRTGLRSGSFGTLRRHLSMTAGNYLATIMGILPATIVPFEVLAIRGAAENGIFATVATIGGFLNVIPATVSMVLFAEASRQGAPLGQQLRKALRGTYGLLLPAMIIAIATAPWVLRIFGAEYASAGTSCLRVMALSALPMGGTYLVDSLLIARDRTTAYVFMNGANAALVLGLVAVLLPLGLTAAAVGWTLAQVASLLLGLIVLATGRAGRHGRKASASPAMNTSLHTADSRQAAS